MPISNSSRELVERERQARRNDENIRIRNRAALSALFRRDRFVALCVFAIAAVAYLATMSSQVMPGESAEWLATAVGLKENFTARHFVWRKFLWLVASVAPKSHLALFANACFALVSAAAVALLYLVMSQFVSLCCDREFLDTKAPGLAEPRISATSLAGGLVSAAVLAFSAPYWSCASQVRLENFHLAWLLLAVSCLLRFGAGGGMGWLFAFAALEGAGASQESCFVAWAPLLLLYAVWLLWTREKLTPARTAALAAAALVPFALCLFAAVSSHMGSPAVTVYAPGTAALDVARHLLRVLGAGVMSTFGQAWWLILLGLTVLPWLASMAVARNALNGESGIAMFMLHLAIAVTTLCVVLDMRFSPWKLAHGDYQIMPYAMTSLSAGYLVAWLFARASFDCLPADPRRCRIRSGVAAVAAAIVACVAAVRSFPDASPSRTEFVRQFCDRLVESLEGRDWLFTNGAYDAELLLRARERGVPLHVVNLAQPGGLRSTSGYREDLPDVRLRNVAEIAPPALLREWISNREDAGSRVALSIVPDLWHQGPWTAFPSGPVFIGLTPEGADARVEEVPLEDSVRDLLDDLRPVLDSVPDDALPRLRWLSRVMRRAASLSGNNAGFLLETRGHSEEAFRVYDMVRKFDPDNVSAVLNWVSLIRGGLHPEMRDEAVKALEDLRVRRADKSDNIWSLAASCGYVSSPVAFANLGWTWALSGQPTLAANSLGRAIRDVGQGDQTRLRAVLAGVYMRGGELEKSEEEFKRILAEDPGAPNAILGLARIAVMRGDFAAARRRIEEGRSSGIPEDRLLFELGAIELGAGDPDAASTKADELEALDPRSVEARTLRAAILLLRHSAAPSGPSGDAERASALDAMSAVVSDLEKLAGPEDVRTLGPRARMEELEGKWSDARADWTLALRASHGADTAHIRESILRADYALADKSSAARHARDLLAISPDNAFANYILGSLALEAERLESAEDFLRRALENAPQSIPALNDLADAELALGKYDESEALVKRLLGMGVDFYGAWDTLALVRLAKGDKQGAREAMDRALALDVDHDPRISLHYARVLAETGEHDEAVATMRDLMPRRNDFRGRDARDFSALAMRLRIGH